MRFFTLNKLYIKYLIATLYAIIICIYPYPANFDISRFVGYYDSLSSTDDFYTSFLNILVSTPDFISKIFISLLVFLGLPIELFFITITFITVCLLFLFFEKLHVFERRKLPSTPAYLFFTLCLPIAAILSGIRNIHAWSVVLWVFCEYYTKSKKNYKALLYAGAFHFAAYLFFPILFFVERIERISLKKICVYSFLIGLLIKVFILLDVKQWIYLVPLSISLKLNFYLDESVFLLSKLDSESIKGFFYRFFYLYYPLSHFLFIYFKKEIKNISTLWYKIGLMYYFFFILYPDILNRMTMFLNFIMITLFFTNHNFFAKKQNLYYLVYLFICSVVAQYLFWKSVYIYS